MKANTNSFPQGNVIKPSLTIFTLNGLENYIKSRQLTVFCPEKYAHR